MAEVALAFLWHQHQPYYPDDVGGDNPMPWVRLHGVKDYYGMALHLLEFPAMRCTINLVPSLLRQLEAYTQRGGSDRFLEVSRLPAEALTEADALFLLENFFMASPERMIRPLARYDELYRRRGLGRDSAAAALRRYDERDLRDLQVCFNLAWVHPLAFERDEGLRALRDKGRSFTEAEKNWLLDKHLAILREVIPLHRQLAGNGQVELTTTPFYHPILPLLLDKRFAREAMPDVRLPRFPGGYLEDAEVHVRRALECHVRVFGRQPEGMWPAEGSVCQAIVPVLARQGIRWIATDEEILGHSTQGFVSRDPRGHVRNPGHLYRPYRVAEGDHQLNVVFRDHALSDLIGFHYQRSEPAAAADDFVGHLRAIGRAVPGDSPLLVSVILDGENCWEHYAQGGVPFLRALYQRCCEAPGIRPVSIGGYLGERPPQDTLPRLFAGSWIAHNFAIWIGHDEDNTAWDLLHRTREFLRSRCGTGTAPAEQIERAWEEIYIAEGSDWFWWYGDDHSSAQDALFDALFRKHLQNVYLILGEPPPPDLSRPISRRGHRPRYTPPRALLEGKLDGQRSFLRWAGAGRYTARGEQGTMAQACPGPIRELYFGFDLQRLLLRVDFDRPAREVMVQFDALRVSFAEPAGWQLIVQSPGAGAELRHHGEAVAAPDAAAAIGQVVETALPFDRLGVAVGQPIDFFVELFSGGQSRDRAPRDGTIHLCRPGRDFEQAMWDA